MKPLIELVEFVEATTKSTDGILPGFPKRVSGEILFCDADTITKPNNLLVAG
ncbi:hypothetical protein F5X99DRAFT_392534 [Biscogniauxia marginata]|nr:hypothetical protein F5X99DRAFT_392534 [Biscogniauxia marginata]